MQKRIPLSRYCIIPIVSIALMIGLNNILLVMDIAQYSEAYRQAADVLYAPSLAVRILYSGITMPILEELIFRGFLFRFIRRKLSFVWAMLISALVFGIYHGNLVQFIYASLCGILLAYLYEVYGNIIAPIFAHITMNVMAHFMTEFGVFSWIMTDILRVIVSTGLCATIVCGTIIYMQKME